MSVGTDNAKPELEMAEMIGLVEKVLTPVIVCEPPKLTVLLTTAIVSFCAKVGTNKEKPELSMAEMIGLVEKVLTPVMVCDVFVVT